MMFRMLGAIYLQNLNKTAEDNNVNRYFFSKIMFWNDVIIRSTNEYYYTIHYLKYILNTLPMLRLEIKTESIDENILEKYLFDRLREIYPNGIYNMDLVIGFFGE